MFINDRPELVKNFCKLFADDSKLIGVIRNNMDKLALQDDLDLLVDWSRNWKLSFNEDKCKLMNIGKTALGATSLSMKSANGCSVELKETLCERDLGVMLNNKLNWKDQVDHAVQMAQSTLAMLKRTFVYWDAKMFVLLFTIYVRPHLEYCAAVWNPSRKREVTRLEQVQRRATKLVPQIRHLNYESRLANLGLTSLEARRSRGDLIQYFKFFKGHNLVNWYYGSVTRRDLGIIGPSSGTRGPQHRLVGQFTRNDKRKQFFTNRIVNEWNKLDNKVVSSETVNGFKNNLDKFCKA